MCKTFHGIGKIVIITQETKITYMHLLMPFGKPYIWRQKRPEWSSLMQMAQKGSHPGQFSIFYLPVIHMNPSCQMCSSWPQNIPIIAFDQPLWWKAPQMRESQSHNTMHRGLRAFVLSLGFHTGHCNELSCIHWSYDDRAWSSRCTLNLCQQCSQSYVV